MARDQTSLAPEGTRTGVYEAGVYEVGVYVIGVELRLKAALSGAAGTRAKASLSGAVTTRPKATLDTEP